MHAYAYVIYMFVSTYLYALGFVTEGNGCCMTCGCVMVNSKAIFLTVHPNSLSSCKSARCGAATFQETSAEAVKASKRTAVRSWGMLAVLAAATLRRSWVLTRCCNLHRTLARDVGQRRLL